MNREDFTFDSRDGKTKIHAVRWTPDGEVKGVLQIIHGMAEYIGRYENVAEWFTRKGFVVTGEDHMGHGGSVKDGDTFGYFCKQDPATVVVRDAHRLKKLTQEKYPGKPYYILGHSMGSFILRNYMFKYGSGIDGAIVCGTGSQPALVVKFGLFLASFQSLFLGDKHVAKMINSIAFGDPKKVKPGEVNDWLCTDHEVVVKYDADPWCGFTFTLNGFKTLFTLLDRLNKSKNISDVPKDLPIFIISGSEDTVGNCGVGVKKVFEEYKKHGIKDVSMVLYEGMKHEILNEPIREQVYADVENFILERSK